MLARSMGDMPYRAPCVRNLICVATSTERMRRLRERRAAGLLPADGQAPRDADDLLAPAVEETLAALKLADSDHAAAAMARQYARVIDEARDQAWAYRWPGPELLRLLVALQATPASRPAPKREPRRPSQLDRLRQAHVQHPAVQRRAGR
jgi:hypothetical protein